MKNLSNISLISAVGAVLSKDKKKREAKLDNEDGTNVTSLGQGTVHSSDGPENKDIEYNEGLDDFPSTSATSVNSEEEKEPFEKRQQNIRISDGVFRAVQFDHHLKQLSPSNIVSFDTRIQSSFSYLGNYKVGHNIAGDRAIVVYPFGDEELSWNSVNEQANKARFYFTLKEIIKLKQSKGSSRM